MSSGGFILAASVPPAGPVVQWVWLHPPGPWLGWLAVLLLAAAVAGVWMMYRRETGQASLRARRGLALVRTAVWVAVAVMLLGPALQISQRQVQPPTVVVLLDDSASMGIADRYADPAQAQAVAAWLGISAAQLRDQGVTRARMVERLWTREGGAWDQALARRGQVRVATFASQVTEAAAPSGGAPPTLTAHGATTDVARALRQALRESGGAPLAAVVLVSDGQVTEGDDPLGAAEQAAAAHVPVLAVGVGDPSPVRNARVTEVWAPSTVWRGDPFEIEAALQSQGLAGQTVQVELLTRPLDESAPTAPDTQPAPPDAAVDWRVAQRREVRLGDDGQATVDYQTTADAAEHRAYSVRVLPVEGETILDDNTGPAAVVDVSAQPARVLLLAGGPSWDYQLVKNLLLRERSVQLSCWLQSLSPRLPQEGDPALETLPDRPESLFPFDVVVMIDPSPLPQRRPPAIDAAWIDLLRRFVGEQGGGLLFAAGPAHTGRFLTMSTTRDVQTILPVENPPDQALDIESLVRPPTHPWPMRFTAEAQDHPILRWTSDPQMDRRLWEALPGVYWSFPIASAKPGARVLIEHSDPALRGPEGARPLLVSGQYGPGRTLYLGLDATWRWRQMGHESEYFDRFWLQAVRYLVEGRRVTTARRGTISLSAPTYTVGATVAVSARLLDAAYAPLARPQVTAQVTAPDGSRQTVTLTAATTPTQAQAGVYEGGFLVRQTGRHDITIDLAPDATGRPVRVSRSLNVEEPRVEWANPRLDGDRLRAIAQRSGGAYADITQADQLVSLIPDRTQVRLVPAPPHPLWDSPWVIAVLTALLALEWFLRRRWRML